MIKWVELIATLWGQLLRYFNDKRLIDSGKAQAELDGRKELEKVSNDIAIAKSDDELRKSTRKKYTRPKRDKL